VAARHQANQRLHPTAESNKGRERPRVSRGLRPLEHYSDRNGLGRQRRLLVVRGSPCAVSCGRSCSRFLRWLCAVEILRAGIGAARQVSRSPPSGSPVHRPGSGAASRVHLRVCAEWTGDAVAGRSAPSVGRSWPLPIRPQSDVSECHNHCPGRGVVDAVPIARRLLGDLVLGANLFVIGYEEPTCCWGRLLSPWPCSLRRHSLS
jgi:hypothetical protein